MVKWICMEATLKTSPLSQLIARAILHLLSWRVDVVLPPSPKFIMVGAPHTSGWDLFFAVLLMHASGIKIHFVGKDSLFHGPFGVFMRWLGGIPVQRHAKGNFVQQLVDVFNRSTNLVIAISPEGTRGKIDYWRTGFYYIALGAGVPIALGFVDYENRVVGIGPSFYPTGDLAADFELVKKFYIGIQGRHPKRQGEIRIREIQG
jgi:1-acyl-sn-glycerol-3-phosphate acyltransferase